MIKGNSKSDMGDGDWNTSVWEDVRRLWDSQWETLSLNGENSGDPSQESPTFKNPSNSTATTHPGSQRTTFKGLQASHTSVGVVFMTVIRKQCVITDCYYTHWWPSNFLGESSVDRWVKRQRSCYYSDPAVWCFAASGPGKLLLSTRKMFSHQSVIWSSSTTGFCRKTTIQSRRPSSSLNSKEFKNYCTVTVSGLVKVTHKVYRTP